MWDYIFKCICRSLYVPFPADGFLLLKTNMRTNTIMIMATNETDVATAIVGNFVRQDTHIILSSTLHNKRNVTKGINYKNESG